MKRTFTQQAAIGAVSGTLFWVACFIIFYLCSCNTPHPKRQESTITEQPSLMRGTVEQTAKNDGKTAKGIYGKTDWTKPVAEDYVANPNITGISLNAYWRDMNPKRGVYDWSRLDALGKLCLKYDKKIAFNFAAGCKYPEWTKCRTLTFVEFHHGGEDTKPITYIQPVVWDTAYINNWLIFIDTLGKFCEKQKYWSNINTVSITGIDRTTEEIRLPCMMIDGSTNADSLWRTVGYTSEKVVPIFEMCLNHWRLAFPKRVTSYAYINGQDFPFVNEDNIVWRSCSSLASSTDTMGLMYYKYTSLTDNYSGSDRYEYLTNELGSKSAAQLNQSQFQYTTDTTMIHNACEKAKFYKMRSLEVDKETVVNNGGIIGRYNKEIK